MALLLGLTGCSGGAILPNPGAPRSEQLERVAAFPRRQVTGVAVAADHRLFVCFPRWSDDHDLSVAQLMPDGALRPYPDGVWNTYIPALSGEPGARFVCVQSVVADDQDQLWVLDPAAPDLQGPIPGGPKLVQIDLATDTVARIYPFDDTIAPPGSYLNDVRVDTQRRVAYLTDSGLGAIVVVNLDTGTARRLLTTHHSTRAYKVKPVIGHKPWKRGGKTPQVHADGIALSVTGEYLYYHALTGYRTFRVPTHALRTLHNQPQALAAAVEDLGPDAITDGMLIDRDNNLYLTALEYDGILKRRPTGEMVPVVLDTRLAWPDSMAVGPDGTLYITTSQIHRSGSGKPHEPYALWKLDADIRR